MKRLLSFILVLLALSATGKTRDQVAVDACGATTQRTGIQTDTPFLYNGAYGVVTDPNGLLHMQARYYNPNIRRFINADPSGFSGGMNFYAFAGGDPVSLIDPSGLGASPIDGSEDYDPMMEGDRVKATLANLLSFGMAEEAAVSFTGHGLLDDTQVSTAEVWMTRIGFAASFIPFERVAKLASGLAGKAAVKVESFGIRGAESRLAPFMQCFPAGTLVLMADGSAKPIEEIEEGDQVLADDPNDREPAAPHKVTQLYHNWTQRLIHVAIDNYGDGKADGEIKATGEHPFWTANRGWIAAKDLKSGDVLQGTGDAAPVVVSAESVTTTTDTFNLTVDGTHTFFAFAGDIAVLVHNTVPFDVAPFGSFNSPQAFVNGGAFERHEMLQWGWMRANNYGTEGFRAGNPSMALDRAFHRGVVTPLQRQAGLHVMQDLAGQSAYDNIRANIRVLEQAGVSRDAIARQAWQAKTFANSLPCP